MQIPSKNYSGKLFKSNIFLQVCLPVHWMHWQPVINFYLATGKNPIIIFVYIASGVFGKQAYSSWAILLPLLGLLFHYCFAIIFSAFYFLMYPKLKLLHWNKIIAAIIYGIFVWLVMNLCSCSIKQSTVYCLFILQNALLAVCILIVCIGIPISFIASSFYKKNK